MKNQISLNDIKNKINGYKIEFINIDKIKEDEISINTTLDFLENYSEEEEYNFNMGKDFIRIAHLEFEVQKYIITEVKNRKYISVVKVNDKLVVDHVYSFFPSGSKEYYVFQGAILFNIQPNKSKSRRRKKKYIYEQSVMYYPGRIMVIKDKRKLKQLGNYGLDLELLLTLK